MLVAIPQQGRFATSARPDNRRKASGLDVQVHLVERNNGLATALKDHGYPIDPGIARHQTGADRDINPRALH
jgi:hypothetical protein